MSLRSWLVTRAFGTACASQYPAPDDGSVAPSYRSPAEGQARRRAKRRRKAQKEARKRNRK